MEVGEEVGEGAFGEVLAVVEVVDDDVGVGDHAHGWRFELNIV